MVYSSTVLVQGWFRRQIGMEFCQQGRVHRRVLVGLNSSSSSFFMRKTTNIDLVDVVFIAYKGRRRERGREGGAR